MIKFKCLLLLIVNGISVCCLAQSNEFYFNGGADVIFRYHPRGTGGRAFVHDDGNMLSLNYGGDFSGGTKIGNFFHVGNDGALTIPDGAPLKTSFLTTNNYSTMSFASRAWASVQGENRKAFSFLTHSDVGQGGFEAMAIYYGESGKIVMAHNGGNVGIGTANPNAKLAVNGNIRAKEIKVETANWPDYVFATDYQLPTLQQTKKHIRKNGHLPGMPSAKEAEANGVDLGEMNKKLLEKIEELTLHLIELNEKFENQQKEINKLKHK